MTSWVLYTIFSNLVSALAYTYTQCGNFRIFLSFRFYVKSIFENQELVKLPFFANFGDLNFVNLVNISLKKEQRFIKIKIERL